MDLTNLSKMVDLFPCSRGNKKHSLVHDLNMKTSKAVIDSGLLLLQGMYIYMWDASYCYPFTLQIQY